MLVILVPVDGSKHALRAVEFAISAAKRTRTMVHLLNVQLPLDHYGMVAAYLDKRTHRKFTTESGNAALLPAVKRLQRARIPHASHVLYGDIAATITRTARRLKCDSIVMGTRGMGTVGNLLLGSVTNKVIHLTRIPVTLIK